MTQPDLAVRQDSATAGIGVMDCASPSMFPGSYLFELKKNSPQ